MVFLLMVQGCTTKLTTYGQDQHTELALQPQEGLVLMRVANHRVLSKIMITGEQGNFLLNWDALQTYNRYSTPYGNHGDYYLFSMPAGEYRVSKLIRYVATLKSWATLSEEDNPGLWSFRVEANRINYIGDFHTQVSRQGYLGQIHFTNRSSFALDFSQKQLPELLVQYPLVYSGAGRDDLFEVMR
ncbi:hypothetical protein KUW04_08440 [Halomonas denitrificans]|nr:hypothetical protein [Halomonas denitrificans]